MAGQYQCARPTNSQGQLDTGDTHLRALVCAGPTVFLIIRCLGSGGINDPLPPGPFNCGYRWP